MKCEVVYEDKDIIVIYKPAGLASQSAKVMQPDVVSELLSYLKTTYIGIVHRLDQPVEGLLVFGKTKTATGNLNKQLTEGSLKKRYYAVVLCNGLSSDKVITLEDYLAKNSKTSKSEIVQKDNPNKPQKAILNYKIVYANNEIALADIELMTGRFHQIRAQMSHAGLPLLGDLKYGSKESILLTNQFKVQNVALCAYSLTFIHPNTNKKMDFSIKPKNKIFDSLISVL